MKLRLLKPHDYNGKRYNVNDEIEVPSRSMSDYLIKMGVGEIIVEPEKEELQPLPEKVEMQPSKEKIETTGAPKKRGRKPKEK